MGSNYILPPGGSFQAVVDGKATGLAGCSRAAECCHRTVCLRADQRLTSRADLMPGRPITACEFFILTTES